MLIKKMNKKMILRNLGMMTLFLLVSSLTLANTNGGSSTFSTLIDFLRKIQSDMKVILSIATGIVGVWGFFRFIVDQNIGGLIQGLVGIILTLAIIFGFDSFINGVGGMILIN